MARGSAAAGRSGLRVRGPLPLANWSVSPSGNVVRALAANGIPIDTSVFKYGRRDGLVAFDYSRAQCPRALAGRRAGHLPT